MPAVLYACASAVAAILTGGASHGRFDGTLAAPWPPFKRTLFQFANDEKGPPCAELQENDKTPFVWADQHN